MAVLEAVPEVAFRGFPTPPVALPPTKSAAVRSYQLGMVDDQPAVRYSEQRTIGGKESSDVYLYDFTDDGTLFAKQDDDSDVYEVHTNLCNCCGFGRFGYCKHVELAQRLRG